MIKVDPVLYERLVTLIGSMGYELVGCELLPQGRQVVFRIYIDGENGVTLDDCSRVSHQVSAMMDVEDPIQGRYSLEISSPGIDRPLFDIEHYRRYVGKRVKIRLYSPINQRRQYTGVLQRVEGDDIYLMIEGLEHEIKLSFSAIEKANLIGDVRFK
ncbi:MAG: ribosome maturation factor RimP [Gammaproteobacteria bacterium]|nr:ribosome maturation factor RimP [Gammaproteobacteria bacterium]MCW5583611.1 ribosome maturation factor RimP [Gammaproteobacteria bacterium]